MCIRDREDDIYERYENLKYLGVLFTDDNKTSREIRARISAGIRWYYALANVLWSRNVNRKLNIKIYKTPLYVKHGLK